MSFNEDFCPTPCPGCGNIVCLNEMVPIYEYEPDNNNLYCRTCFDERKPAPRKVLFYVETDNVGSRCEEEMEFDWDAEDGEIEAALKEWYINFIDYGFKPLES